MTPESLAHARPRRRSTRGGAGRHARSRRIAGGSRGPGNRAMSSSRSPASRSRATRSCTISKAAAPRAQPCRSVNILRDGKALTVNAVLKAQELRYAAKGEALDARLAGAQFSDSGESLRRRGITGVMTVSRHLTETSLRVTESGLAQRRCHRRGQSARYRQRRRLRTRTSSAKPRQLVFTFVVAHGEKCVLPARAIAPGAAWRVPARHAMAFMESG